MGKVPEIGKLASEVAKQLRLARSTFVGLAERVETLKRWLPEQIETIERDFDLGLKAFPPSLRASPSRR